MKRLKRIGDALIGGLLRAVFFLWGGVTRLLYLPRVVYTDPSVKKTMKRGAILIANHTSHKDGFFIPQMFPLLGMRVLFTRKWYDKKLLTPIFRHLGYLPINLNEPDADWMAQSEETLKKGRCVLIFPEGKLEHDGVPEPFHSGFLLPAKHLDVPVIPMAVVGGYRVFRRQKLIVGSPVPLELHAPGRLSAVLKTAADRCRDEVFALRDGRQAERATEKV